MAWQRPEVDSSYAFISQAALAFEAELYRALEDVPSESMPPEHVTLLQEFEYLYQELEEFRHFDQIIDSGIVQRVRELKQSLGMSFYHPDSLANLAVWNDVFGRKFDELFHDAAVQIKSFRGDRAARGRQHSLPGGRRHHDQEPERGADRGTSGGGLPVRAGRVPQSFEIQEGSGQQASGEDDAAGRATTACAAPAPPPPPPRPTIQSQHAGVQGPTTSAATTAATRTQAASVPQPFLHRR